MPKGFEATALMYTKLLTKDYETREKFPATGVDGYFYVDLDTLSVYLCKKKKYIFIGKAEETETGTEPGEETGSDPEDTP